MRHRLSLSEPTLANMDENDPFAPLPRLDRQLSQSAEREAEGFKGNRASRRAKILACLGLGSDASAEDVRNADRQMQQANLARNIGMEPGTPMEVLEAEFFRLYPECGKNLGIKVG